MKSETVTIKVTATFNDERTHRFSLYKEWDKKLKSALVIMKCPSAQKAIETDTTTMLVTNNLSKLDYGSVYITNLYSKLNSTSITKSTECEEENFKHIASLAKDVDTVIIAWGSVGEGNNLITEKQNRLLALLKQYKDKTVYIAHPQDETKGQHPLSPHVRNNWDLKKYGFTEHSKPKEVATSGTEELPKPNEEAKSK